MSVYVALKHVKTTKDEPLKFNSNMTDYLLSHIPYTPSPDSETRKLVRESEVEHYREIIENEKICPSQLEPLAKYVLNTARKSLIVPGDSTGFVAAESTGVIQTQAALNSFHGSNAVVLDSSEAQNDVVSASKNPKTKILTIFFEDKTLSFEDVLNKRRSLSSASVFSFIESYEIELAPEIDGGWWRPSNVVSDVVLRIHLNWVEMYKQQITIHELAKVIRAGEKDEFIVAHGGIMDRIIDIYPNKIPVPKFENEEVAKRYIEESYLFINFIDQFKNINAKGISGVGQLEPKSVSLGSLIQNLSKKGDWYRIKINLKLASHQGITKEDYMETFRSVKCEIKDEGSDVFFCRLPELARYETSNSTAVIIRDGEKYEKIEGWIKEKKSYYRPVFDMEKYDLLKENGYYEKIQNPLVEGDLVFSRLPSDTKVTMVSPFDYLSRSKAKTERYYAVAKGTNFMDLLCTPGIDKTKTITSNIHVISAVLGSEAARVYSNKVNHKFISDSKSYVNTANITLLPTITMSKGIPLGARYAGAARQGAGFLTLTTIEKAGSIKDFALFGKSETVANTSAAIALGDYIHLGTHYSHISQTSLDGKIYTNEDVFTLKKGRRELLAIENKLRRDEKVKGDSEENFEFVPNNVVETSWDENPEVQPEVETIHSFTAPMLSTAYDAEFLYKDIDAIEGVNQSKLMRAIS